MDTVEAGRYKESIYDRNQCQNPIAGRRHPGRVLAARRRMEDGLNT
ncbi:MAG TPA: hypothetical protein VI136_15565 [Verrucomicrobiae bacterium]